MPRAASSAASEPPLSYPGCPGRRHDVVAVAREGGRLTFGGRGVDVEMRDREPDARLSPGRRSTRWKGTSGTPAASVKVKVTVTTPCAFTVAAVICDTRPAPGGPGGTGWAWWWSSSW